MQPAPSRGVLIEMLRERTPVVGITIAVLVLLLEGAGLVAYQHHQRDVDARAAREAEAAKAKVHKLIDRASRIDRALEELEKRIRNLDGYEWDAHPTCDDEQCRIEAERRLQELQKKLHELKQRATPEHNDMLIPPPKPRELRSGRV